MTAGHGRRRAPDVLTAPRDGRLLALPARDAATWRPPAPPALPRASVLPEEPPHTPDQPASPDTPSPDGGTRAPMDALRAALAGHARGEPISDALVESLRRVSRDARTRGITAERLLIDFKLLWYALPEVRTLRQQQQSDGLAELVTLCIREYYKPGP